ncbi:MAG: GGDEF domain-containing phosphodiesterase [Nanoarchaeota archaeon]|nr:GGDEF domain-containing phosphodiesterase [Nanoarchaeota archaeon]
MSASIGISLFPNDGLSSEEIIKNSEKAMNEAKKSSSTKVIYYNQNFKQRDQYITEVVEQLKGCIAEDGFEIVYQPQVNTENETILALEALLRMKKSKLSPGIFVPIAEKSGLMNQIGRIVILKVIEQLASWSEKGFQVLPIYINFSSSQLHDQTISTYIENLLKQYKVNPSSLGIEITEDVFVDKESFVINILKDLKNLGLHTAIDDFGAGQAGVNYLTNFEVDLVKIDKGVADKYLNEEKSIVYSTVVKLCTTLGFQVLAEGIETVEQVNYLKQMGVTYIQGFYYYKPLCVKDIESKLIKIQK